MIAPDRLPPGFGIRPIHAVLGAEVLGADLAQPVDDVVFAALYDTFLPHHLLVFRAQLFSDDQHAAFARRWRKFQRYALNQYRQSATDFDWMTDVRIMHRTTTVGERIDPGMAMESS